MGRPLRYLQLMKVVGFGVVGWTLTPRRKEGGGVSVGTDELVNREALEEGVVARTVIGKRVG